VIVAPGRGVSSCAAGSFRRSGFTLIEILAVIVILALLATALLSVYAPNVEAVQIQTQRAEFTKLAAACSQYENDEGDYPPSSFPQKLLPTGGGSNGGIECLVVHLWRDGREGYGMDSDLLVNTDGDRTSRSLTDMGSLDLLEFIDQWENPVAYIHNSDYGGEFLYRTLDSNGEDVENLVQARKNPTTETWYKRTRFQLISAGPDGLFGNDDDVTGFGR